MAYTLPTVQGLQDLDEVEFEDFPNAAAVPHHGFQFASVTDMVYTLMHIYIRTYTTLVHFILTYLTICFPQDASTVIISDEGSVGESIRPKPEKNYGYVGKHPMNGEITPRISVATHASYGATKLLLKKWGIVEDVEDVEDGDTVGLPSLVHRTIMKLLWPHGVAKRWDLRDYRLFRDVVPFFDSVKHFRLNNEVPEPEYLEDGTELEVWQPVPAALWYGRYAEIQRYSTSHGWVFQTVVDVGDGDDDGEAVLMTQQSVMLLKDSSLWNRVAQHIRYDHVCEAAGLYPVQESLRPLTTYWNARKLKRFTDRLFISIFPDYVPEEWE